MKNLLFILLFGALFTGIVIVPIYVQETSRWEQQAADDPWNDDPNHVEKPAWIPDTLCNGRPSVKSWNRTDEYRLKTGDMFFEWEFNALGDSCLFAIVVRLPDGTIDNILKSAR